MEVVDAVSVWYEINLDDLLGSEAARRDPIKWTQPTTKQYIFGLEMNWAHESGPSLFLSMGSNYKVSIYYGGLNLMHH